MRKITLLLAICGLALCQELIVEKVDGQFNTGDKFEKVYQRPEWDDIQDFAIYGWFKISSQYPRSDWLTAYHFTSNDNSTWTNKDKPGDRVLSLFFIGNRFACPTYTTSNANLYNNLYFQDSDVDKWVFHYAGYSSQQKTHFSYFSFASGVQTDKMLNVEHTTSKFYQINVGQSFYYKYFPGTIWRLSLFAGKNAYMESGFETLQNLKPDLQITCPLLFTGCNYTGQSTSLCEKQSSYNIASIHSIYVPENTSVTLFKKSGFKGASVTYKQNVECMNQQKSLIQTNEDHAYFQNNMKKGLRKNN